MSNRYDAAQRALIRAWYDWRHTELPVDDFRQNRTASPTYLAELTLDHLRAYVYALGSAYFEGRPRDYPEAIANHLEALHTAETAFEEAAIDDERRRPYRAYADATRTLLHALLRSLAATDHAS